MCGVASAKPLCVFNRQTRKILGVIAAITLGASCTFAQAFFPPGALPDAAAVRYTQFLKAMHEPSLFARNYVWSPIAHLNSLSYSLVRLLFTVTEHSQFKVEGLFFFLNSGQSATSIFASARNPRSVVLSEVLPSITS